MSATTRPFCFDPDELQRLAAERHEAFVSASYRRTPGEQKGGPTG